LSNAAGVAATATAAFADAALRFGILQIIFCYVDESSSKIFVWC
jgi:hypothetical protein